MRVRHLEESWNKVWSFITIYVVQDLFALEVRASPDDYKWPSPEAENSKIAYT